MSPSYFPVVYIFTLMASQLIQAVLGVGPIRSRPVKSLPEQIEPGWILAAAIPYLKSLPFHSDFADRKGETVYETFSKYSGCFLPYIFGLTLSF